MIHLHIKLNIDGETFPYVSVRRLTQPERGIWQEIMDFSGISATDLYDTTLMSTIGSLMTHDVAIRVDGKLEGIAHSIAHCFVFEDEDEDEPTPTIQVGFDDEGAPYLVTKAGMFQTKGGDHFITIHAR